ncbi:hypothetical protein FHETE_4095 [Fusarium heterosporum]|uniref:Myb-like domain-containing protein n=1 Tax=Fusarium heterosporum TaxID=42747 RepID=A0A8H5WUK0_FUSHE|nr:hypothetical protein FHETE_4095 [Fusarium heterosporum]
MTTPLSPESFHRSIIEIMSDNSIVPGRAELEGSPAPAISSSSAGDESSDAQQICVKNRKVRGRHVKIVTSSDVETSENPETTESASGYPTEGSDKSLFKANNKSKKAEAAKAKSSTDNESSGHSGEMSADANDSAKSSKASDKDPNWSISEDCRLRSMKEASETWNFIATSLCKTRNEVRTRWKVLQNQSTASEQTTEAETDSAATEGETSSAVTGTEPEGDEAKEDEDPEEYDSNQHGENNDEGDDDAEDDDDENGDEYGEQTSCGVKSKGKGKVSTTSDVMGNASINNKWHKGARNTKVAIENRWAKARAQAKASGESDSIVSGHEASAETSDSSSRLGYGDPEKQKQMKYLQDHIYKEMYPPEIHLKPDTYLGKRDCDLLATIDSKYKKSRWLEMQANFYNVTGRMVPLEAIRARCERAEAEKEERTEARKLERRLNRVENWIASQACENSQD